MPGDPGNTEDEERIPTEIKRRENLPSLLILFVTRSGKVNLSDRKSGGKFTLLKGHRIVMTKYKYKGLRAIVM